MVAIVFNFFAFSKFFCHLRNPSREAFSYNGKDKYVSVSDFFQIPVRLEIHPSKEASSHSKDKYVSVPGLLTF